MNYCCGLATCFSCGAASRQCMDRHPGAACPLCQGPMRPATLARGMQEASRACNLSVAATNELAEVAEPLPLSLWRPAGAPQYNSSLFCEPTMTVCYMAMNATADFVSARAACQALGGTSDLVSYSTGVCRRCTPGTAGLACTATRCLGLSWPLTCAPHRHLHGQNQWNGRSEHAAPTVRTLMHHVRAAAVADVWWHRPAGARRRYH
jgi:hypothetical protein